MKKSLKNQIGRSMIEMLGVLAIIGVLSVAGIAGYSKALLKYKLNKQAEQQHTMIEAVVRHQLELRIAPHKEDGSWNAVYLLPILKSLNEIPAEIEIKKNDPNAIRDAFGVRCQPYVATQNGRETIVYTCAFPARNEYFFFICRNFYQIAKEWHEFIYLAYVQNNDGDHWGSTGIFYGDKSCTGSRKCLKNITLEQIESRCKEADNDGYYGFTMYVGYW